MAMERGTLFFVRPMPPKGGGGIPAVRTFRQWVLTVRACTVFFWRCAAASKPVLLGLGCGSCSYLQKKFCCFVIYTYNTAKKTVILEKAVAALL